MRTSIACFVAIAAACFLSAGFSGVGYAQIQKLNCDVDAICLQSRAPVQGVRIVEEKDYPTRPATYLSSNLYTTLAGDRETDRKFCSFDFKVTPDGGGPDAHTHHNEWETFYVEEGTVTFVVGLNQDLSFHTVDVPAGSVVYGSQGPVHGFKDTSDKPARVFSFVMPCGLDYFFYESGTPVKKWDAPIPPINFDEIVRTAFWAQQRGDGLHIPGSQAPIVPAGTPESLISSINDPARPHETGPFGESRVVLLTEAEVGHITGQEAFCGPGLPPPPGTVSTFGGSVKYSYFTMAAGKGMPAPFISDKTEVFYTQSGTLTFSFLDKKSNQEKRVNLGPRAFVQIDAGTPFSIGNLGNSGDDDDHGSRTDGPASSLAITVIPPASCPPPPPIF